MTHAYKSIYSIYTLVDANIDDDVNAITAGSFVWQDDMVQKRNRIKHQQRRRVSFHDDDNKNKNKPTIFLLW